LPTSDHLVSFRDVFFNPSLSTTLACVVITVVPLPEIEIAAVPPTISANIQSNNKLKLRRLLTKSNPGGST